MNNVYRGRAKKEDREKLITMLDDIFFTDDPEETKRNFVELLPKLYKEKYNPTYNNFVYMEDDEFKGAVGLYPFYLNAGGEKLLISGIGNVAVSRDSRGKGYMIDCMNQCLDQMKSDETVISILGGQRQRYGFFGYEPMGTQLSFKINRRNIAYILGKEYKTTFTAKKLSETDTEYFKKIDELYRSSGVYCDRPLKDYFDILCSWKSVPYAVLDGDRFAGYFVWRKFGGIQEMKAVNVEDTLNFILCALDTMEADELNYELPPYEQDACEYMMKCYDSVSYNHSEMVNVFNYKKFIKATLGVKASRLKLGEGSLVLFIHGYKGDEQLKITVNGSSVFVEETTDTPDFELEHHDAMRMLGGIYSKNRNTLPSFAQNWFPLDFFLSSQDNV